MIPISLEESKKIQVSILESIHAFCKENNLSYALAFGALIGAVRHGGFIPWDDDIDILMPRDAYDYFIANFFDKTGRYKVHSLKNDSKYSLPFAKVEDTRTMLIEKSSRDNSLGISIDVFPADLIGDNMEASLAIVRKIGIIKSLFKGKLVIPNKRNSLIKILGIYGLKFLGLPFSLRFLAKKIENLCSTIGSPEANYMGCLCWGYGKKEIMPRSIFDNYITIQFEGKDFFTFKDWHLFLTTHYGDYMKLPPENKRHSPHEITDIYWRYNEGPISK